MLCGSVDERRAGEYMAEVRTSSQCERPCAGIEETRTALGGAGGSKDPGQRKVHSLIDKVYAPANLAEAWRHVRDNKGGAGIDGLTIAAFADREEERLAALHRKLRDRSYRPTPVKRVGIPKPDGGVHFWILDADIHAFLRNRPGQAGEADRSRDHCPAAGLEAAPSGSKPMLCFIVLRGRALGRPAAGWSWRRHPGVIVGVTMCPLRGGGERCLGVGLRSWAWMSAWARYRHRR